MSRRKVTSASGLCLETNCYVKVSIEMTASLSSTILMLFQILCSILHSYFPTLTRDSLTEKKR
jgi:hypothetical protein